MHPKPIVFLLLCVCDACAGPHFLRADAALLHACITPTTDRGFFVGLPLFASPRVTRKCRCFQPGAQQRNTALHEVIFFLDGARLSCALAGEPFVLKKKVASEGFCFKDARGPCVFEQTRGVDNGGVLCPPPPLPSSLARYLLRFPQH